MQRQNHFTRVIKLRVPLLQMLAHMAGVRGFGDDIALNHSLAAITDSKNFINLYVEVLPAGSARLTAVRSKMSAGVSLQRFCSAMGFDSH